MTNDYLIVSDSIEKDKRMQHCGAPLSPSKPPVPGNLYRLSTRASHTGTGQALISIFCDEWEICNIIFLQEKPWREIWICHDLNFDDWCKMYLKSSILLNSGQNALSSFQVDRNCYNWRCLVLPSAGNRCEQNSTIFNAELHLLLLLDLLNSVQWMKLKNM
jgi:hypothetical protein